MGSTRASIASSTRDGPARGTLRRRLLLAAALGGACRSAWPQRSARVVVIPKLTGIPYYDAVKRGVDAAAAELPELSVVWDGPAQDQVEQQIALVEHWIAQRPDLLAVAADDGLAIAPVLTRAQRAGIHVMSWDADCSPREFFVNLVDYQDFGDHIVEVLARDMPDGGELAIVTTSFRATNQVRWINAIKRAIAAQRRRWRIVDIRPAGESGEQAYRVTRGLLQSYPALKGVVGLGSPNLPGVARAIREVGLAGRIAVTGNSLPGLMRDYLNDGTVRAALLWNPQDHGYLTVYCARQLLRGGLRAGQAFNAGTLGPYTPRADEINAQVALPVLVYDKDSVDRYRF